nr:hypothetical protein [uncultured Gellertiella sp.]
MTFDPRDRGEWESNVKFFPLEAEMGALKNETVNLRMDPQTRDLVQGRGGP